MLNSDPKLQRSPNTENSEKENSKENKKEIHTIEIDGIPLEYTKENFEYPGYIQKETGIIGYERMILKEDVLKKSYENYKEIHKDDDEATRISLLYKWEEDILSKLSGEEYDMYLFLTHVMGGYAPESYVRQYNKQFVEDKLFLQKIFSLDSAKDLIDKNVSAELEYEYDASHALFSHATHYDQERFGSTFFVIDKNNYRFIEKIPPYKIHEYRDNKDVFLCAVNKGLNVVARPDEYGVLDLFSNKVKFNFSLKDKLFSEYIKKTYDIDKKLNDINKGVMTINRSPDFIERKGGVDWLEERFSRSLYGQFPEFVSTYFNLDMSYPRIPIFINSDEVMQLSWGHAQYAHFMSSKGFNLIKFKHADHLPEPKSETKDNKYLI
ncbi:MAG: hypothetical protein WCO35_02015 [Candidatus Nomurabacteria bacterium]